MLGTSPRPHNLTARQMQVSNEVTAAVPALPVALVDLISQMTAPDFELASVPLELDKDGAVLQNQKNQSILSMIEIALSSPSSDCAPWIKAAIFNNAIGSNPVERVIEPYLVQIINKLQEEEQQINLDDVFLENMRLRKTDGLDLSGMSAQRATFSDMYFFQTKMTQASLMGATFINCFFIECDLSQVNFLNATFKFCTMHSTLACGLMGNQSEILSCSRTLHKTVWSSNGPTLETNIYLDLDQGVKVRPDQGAFTLFPKTVSKREKPVA